MSEASNLYSRKPADVFVEGWHQQYEAELDALWWQFVPLNSYLFIMEKIIAFPFELFGPIENDFWNLTLESMYEASVSILWRTTCDPDKRSLTLPSFKKRIMDNLRSDQYEAEFSKRLEERSFDTRIADIESKVKKLRHKKIAHLDRKSNTQITPEVRRHRELTLGDLKEAGSIVSELFEYFCIGHGRAMALGRYNPGITYPQDTDRRSDIERILDLIAQDSDVLNMPEQQPEFWPHHRETLSTEHIKILNCYRQKFGLPSI